MKSLGRKALLLGMGVFFASGVLGAQEPGPGPAPAEGRQGRGDGRPRPTLGRITAIGNGSVEISRADGTSVTVKLSDKTEFRKDRQPAKLSDFKVGDLVGVRGQENPDHTITAETIGTRSAGMGGGPEGRGALGTLGKDYVAGEVKSIEVPRITVLRTDNQTQAIELNEESSLRKGRDSVTMADVQVGDHIVARGALEGDKFVPKTVMVFDPEQWKRLEEFRRQAEGAGAPAGREAPQAKPGEQPH